MLSRNKVSGWPGNERPRAPVSRGNRRSGMSDCAGMLPFPALAAVFVGGAFGSLARWGILELATGGADPLPGETPAGIHLALLAINVSGSLLLGVLIAQHDLIKEKQFLALGAGFTGGLTTFDTFAVDVAQMLDNGRFLDATANGLGTALGVLLAAGIGYRLGVVSR